MYKDSLLRLKRCTTLSNNLQGTCTAVHNKQEREKKIPRLHDPITPKPSINSVMPAVDEIFLGKTKRLNTNLASQITEAFDPMKN